jgi:F420-0:gamma-glutamyl ligase
MLIGSKEGVLIQEKFARRPGKAFRNAISQEPMPKLHSKSIRTDIFQLGENLADFIIRSVPRSSLSEGCILAVTSKIVSLAEEAIVPKSDISKLDLVERESDRVICINEHYGTALSIKQGLLIPSAGIDESNAKNGEYYILYPKDPFASAQRLHAKLTQHYGLKNLGIILTDSHTQPLRRGVTGISLAHWGFKATRNLVGTEDLFGQKLKMTYVNVVDSLAVAAVFMMGEASERCPLAVLETDGIEFTESACAEEIAIPLYEDLYGPLLKT